jgi:hypothetical protein
MPFEISRDLPAVTGRSLMTLRIIVAALALGPVVFAGVAIGQNAGKPHALAGQLNSLNISLLGLGLITLVLGALVPRIVFAAGRNAKPTYSPIGLSREQVEIVTPELVRIDGILQRIQTATIVGCALFEGGAFANVVGYMQTRELLHLILAGVLILGVLSCFPTAFSFQRRVEDELRQMKDADAFKESS